MSGISSQDKGEHAKGEYNPEEMESKVEILNADTIRTVLTEDLGVEAGQSFEAGNNEAGIAFWFGPCQSH